MTLGSKPIDTTGDIRVTGLKEIAANQTGRWIRVVFVEPDQTERPILLAAELLDHMLPHIMHMAGECERRRTGENAKRAFVIKRGSVSTTAQGIILEFAAPSGQSFAFEMDKDGAKLMLTSLSKALGLTSDHGDKPPPAPLS